MHLCLSLKLNHMHEWDGTNQRQENNMTVNSDVLEVGASRWTRRINGGEKSDTKPQWDHILVCQTSAFTPKSLKWVANNPSMWPAIPLCRFFLTHSLLPLSFHLLSDVFAFLFQTDFLSKSSTVHVYSYLFNLSLWSETLNAFTFLDGVRKVSLLKPRLALIHLDTSITSFCYLEITKLTLSYFEKHYRLKIIGCPQRKMSNCCVTQRSII